MSPRRVLLLGAETEVGRATATALAEAGHGLALVSSTTDATTAFEVQRLARKLGASAQAIDATNEAALRVMVRQVAKELGGIDAAVSCLADVTARANFERLVSREMARTGGGVFVDATAVADVVGAVAARAG
jgi:NAD(P)-dependent dehydrogenase (short-subunit alcohol dehydrogenase family)